MRYLGAFAAVLVAAMAFSLTAIGQPVRTANDKPVIRSMLDRNTILSPSASRFDTITLEVERYMNPPKLLEGLAEINPVTCTEIAVGAWTHTPPQLCQNNLIASGSPLKCGKITRGTETDTIGSGLCAGHTFTFATIYYEWTAHNNQSTLSAPANRVADTFDATWTAPDGSTAGYTFNISVQVVRPDHETTAFVAWPPDQEAKGAWKQTLVPPSSDPTFDFTGETVQEFPAAPAGPDTCWFPKSGRIPGVAISGGTWTVGELDHQFQMPGLNVWGDDFVGYPWRNVLFYQSDSPTLKRDGYCGTRFGQQMEIHAPSDPPNTFTPYGGTNTGNVNLLGASMRKDTVTSTRAGMSETESFPSGH